MEPLGPKYGMLHLMTLGNTAGGQLSREATTPPPKNWSMRYSWVTDTTRQAIWHRRNEIA